MEGKGYGSVSMDVRVKAFKFGCLVGTDGIRS